MNKIKKINIPTTFHTIIPSLLYKPSFFDNNIINSSLSLNKSLYIIFEIFRTQNQGKKCYKEQYFIDKIPKNIMILDLLLFIRNKIDPTLSFRRSCREGICGSCAMNINGKNQLACLTKVSTVFNQNFNIQNTNVKNLTKILLSTNNSAVNLYKSLKTGNNYYQGVLKTSTINKVSIFPLPNLLTLRDLIPDLTGFFNQYKQIKPWLSNNNRIGTQSYKQTIQNRKLLDGLYECILCACCSTTCPSYWWNNIDYLGPAILLQSYRWLIDSRDQDFLNRINNLKNSTSVYKCHQILNCSKVCPKSLNPGKVIKVLQQRIFKGVLILKY